MATKLSLPCRTVGVSWRCRLKMKDEKWLTNIDATALQNRVGELEVQLNEMQAKEQELARAKEAEVEKARSLEQALQVKRRESESEGERETKTEGEGERAGRWNRRCRQEVV